MGYEALTTYNLEKQFFPEYPGIWKRVFPQKAGLGQVGDEMMIGY